VLDAHSFSVDSSGKAVFRKLDPGLHVQLSTSSFRLAPKETYYVFYKATSETLPELVLHLFDGQRPVTPSGLKLAVELPHTVYLLGRKSIDRSDVSWNRAESSAEGGKRLVMPKSKTTARIQPHSGSRGHLRIRPADFRGVPLFPGQRRNLELDWDQPGTPEHIVLKFQHFKLESNSTRYLQLDERSGAAPASLGAARTAAKALWAALRGLASVAQRAVNSVLQCSDSGDARYFLSRTISTSGAWLPGMPLLREEPTPSGNGRSSEIHSKPLPALACRACCAGRRIRRRHL